MPAKRMTIAAAMKMGAVLPDVERTATWGASSRDCRGSSPTPFAICCAWDESSPARGRRGNRRAPSAGRAVTADADAQWRGRPSCERARDDQRCAGAEQHRLLEYIGSRPLGGRILGK